MQASDAISRSKQSDSALVAAMKDGDTRSFEELVLRHRQKLLAVAQRITHHHEDAEDVVQESFHKAFLRFDSFQEKSQFATWMTRIVMNEAFMLLRKRRGVHEDFAEISEDGEQLFSAKFIDQRPSPEESCRLLERRAILTEAIERLGPKVRSAILLRDVEERSAQETARILGTTVSAVKARVFQGRRKLLEIVSPALHAKPTPTMIRESNAVLMTRPVESLVA